MTGPELKKLREDLMAIIRLAPARAPLCIGHSVSRLSGVGGTLQVEDGSIHAGARYAPRGLQRQPRITYGLRQRVPSRWVTCFVSNA